MPLKPYKVVCHSLEDTVSKTISSNSVILSFMEIHLSSVPVLLAFLLYLFMVMRKGKRSKTQDPTPKWPPAGPRKLPVLGNLHNMLGLPHHTLRDLAKKYGPLMHLQLGEVSAVVISSPELAEHIMKTHDLVFADRPEIAAAKIMSYGGADVAFSPYGNYWRQLRKIFMLELLSSKRVQSFRSIREEEVSNLIQNVSLNAGSPINLSQQIFALTHDITSRAAFGKKCGDKEAFISCICEVVRLAGGFGVADLFPSLKFLHVISGMKPRIERIHRKVDRILNDIIKDHKENKKTTNNGEAGEEDLVDTLIRLQETGSLEFPFTNNNLKTLILGLFIAGTETTSTTVEWVMTEMMRNPRVMEKAQAEVRMVFHGKAKIDETEVQNLNYLKLVIKETLRLHPAAALLLPRESRESCNIDGYEIPVKTKVMINAWAIGRDPKHWGDDAERFEPERFLGSSIDFKGTNFEYIPFGGGRRICPGISYALANIELSVAQLLYHFDWKIPNGMNSEDFDMSEAFGAAVRRQNDLYLIPIPYNP